VEDDGVVEEEDVVGADDEDDSANAEVKKNVSPDADTTLLFTKPPASPGDGTGVDLPAGKVKKYTNIIFMIKCTYIYLCQKFDISIFLCTIIWYMYNIMIKYNILCVLY